MLHKHISWRNHKRRAESKIEKKKNISLLHQARQVLTEVSLKTICVSYIHPYLKMQTLHGPIPMFQN